MDIIDIYAKIELLQALDAGEFDGAEPYLWTVFFKIDGSTCRVFGGIVIGTATVVATTGRSHDNLDTANTGTSVDTGELVHISPRLGEFRTRLYPIPFDVPLDDRTEAGGTFGMIAVLLEEDGTSEHDVSVGRRVLTRAVQEQLDALILTLGMGHEEPTPDEIVVIKRKVGAAVREAIANEVSFGNALVGGFDMDNEIGTAFFRFSHATLTSTGGASYPFDETWDNHGKWKISGHLIYHRPATVMIYTKPDYGGVTQKLFAGRYNVDQLAINDSLSSIRIPPSWSVTLFAEAGFRGDSVVLTGDTANVGNTLNNRTSSILVEGPFVTIYRDRGFQGQSQMLRAGRFDVGQLTIGNDSVSSIRVPEGWEATLYSESGFTGSSRVVTADRGYIGNSMENRTSSIIVKSVLVLPIAPTPPSKHAAGDHH